MAGTEVTIMDDNEIDLDIGGVDDDEESIANILRKALSDAPVTEEDDEPDVAPPLPESKNPMVSVEDGLELIEKAGKPEAKAVNADDAPPAAGKVADTKEPAVTPAKEAEPETKEAPVDGPEAKPLDEVDALLDGIDAEKAQKIRDRLSAAAVPESFTTHKDVLTSIAETPDKAVNTLVGLHQYANKNPDQYLAWAAWQLGGDNAAEMITKAAEHLGLRVLPAEEPDAFEDEDTKALREENARLKAQVNGGRPVPFGPDVTPNDPLASFKAETGQDGQLKRPLWNDLAPIIGERALQQRQRTGQPVTVADLDRLYGEEVQRLSAKFAPPPANASLAAQAAPVVADVAGKKPAADVALERAKAASKHIDGGGQGADRHSAPPTDDIGDIIRWQMKQANGG
ncbi:MAG: hypothetical protein IPM06_21040 [Rhizobiales bacterium]|nr:hypothetical protein [Hyphomicrobiales bacterium]